MAAADDLARELLSLPIDVAYLFGSRADGSDGPLSDVDVAILPSVDVPEEARLDLQARVSAIAADHFLVARADVVLLDEAGPELGMAALRGRLILCRDDDRRVVVEARVMSQYHDRAYQRERWYREVPPRWARGEFA